MVRHVTRKHNSPSLVAFALIIVSCILLLSTNGLCVPFLCFILLLMHNPGDLLLSDCISGPSTYRYYC